MQEPDIAFLNASYLDEITSRNFHRDIDAPVTEFDATTGERPDTDSFDGIVISGSSASAYYNKEWITDLVDWTAGAVEAEVPILGICFGHQVLGEALGGRVDELGELELGYQTVRQTAPTPLFEGMDDEFLVFAARSDAVVELPPNARIIAENETGLQAFERAGTFYGFQGHPEFDLETARTVIDEYELPDDVLDPIIARTTEENYERAKESKQIFDNFLEIVSTRQSTEASP